MGTEPGVRRASLVAGILLILLGAAFLAGRGLNIEVSWPAWIVVPGAVIFLVAFAIGGPTGSGFAALGGIVATVGLVLAVQEATHTYASWAYAWALVAPGSVGLSLLLYGLAQRDREMARGGLGALVTGIVFFLVGFLFFEGVIHLDHLGGAWADLVVPVAIVGVGVVLLVAALVPRRRPAPGFADAATAARAGGGGPAGPGVSARAADGRVETLDVPLESASAADVEITFGAGRLEIGPAAAGRLVDGEYDGGVRPEPAGPGRIRLSQPSWSWARGFDRAPFDWLVGLTGEVPLRLALDVGAADANLDLSDLRCTDLRIKTGAAHLRVALPRGAGITRVDAEGGAAALRFTVPDGVAARIRTQVALGSVSVNERRFPRLPGGGWASPDAVTNSNRVDLDVRGGVGSITIA